MLLLFPANCDGNNKVLGSKQPEINKGESKRKRRARTKLAQLKSVEINWNQFGIDLIFIQKGW